MFFFTGSQLDSLGSLMFLALPIEMAKAKGVCEIAALVSPGATTHVV